MQTNTQGPRCQANKHQGSQMPCQETPRSQMTCKQTPRFPDRPPSPPHVATQHQQLSLNTHPVDSSTHAVPQTPPSPHTRCGVTQVLVHTQGRNFLPDTKQNQHNVATTALYTPSNAVQQLYTFQVNSREKYTPVSGNDRHPLPTKAYRHRMVQSELYKKWKAIRMAQLDTACRRNSDRVAWRRQLMKRRSAP